MVPLSQHAPKNTDIQRVPTRDVSTASAASRNEFVVALLTNLQQQHYTPAAWGRFLADSWRQSRATANAHPRLMHSWARISLLMAGVAATGFSVIWLVEGHVAALRLLPALLICLTLQQGDVYVHLGLNWRPPDGLFRERLGLPTTMTLVRGVMANLLLAHLISGVIPSSGYVLGAFLIGCATDLADGPLARRTNGQTRLGGYLDSEADLYLSTAVSLCAWLAGDLPGWIAAIMLLRFAIPLVGTVLSYFVAIRQVALTHTILGRGAGIAQAAFLITALAPSPFAQILAPLYLPLLLLTILLLMLAPLREIATNLILWHARAKRPTT